MRVSWNMFQKTTTAKIVQYVVWKALSFVSGYGALFNGKIYAWTFFMKFFIKINLGMFSAIIGTIAKTIIYIGFDESSNFIEAFKLISESTIGLLVL